MVRTLVGALLAAIVALFATSSPLSGQSTTLIFPDPTGSFAIGRAGYDWTDQSRASPVRDVATENAPAASEIARGMSPPTNLYGTYGSC